MVKIKMLVALVLGANALAAVSAAAQVRDPVTSSSQTGREEDDDQPPQQTPMTRIDTNPSGGTARALAGQVGQRQTRDTTTVETGIKPMARISNRIQNRVQNRIQNRIDRAYDPQASATDPFRVAEDQARIAGQPR